MNTTGTQAQSNSFCPFLGQCPTLGTFAFVNFLDGTVTFYVYKDGKKRA